MRTIRFAGISMLFLFFPHFASGQWVDHFDDICGMSSWFDIQQTEGWNIQVLETYDISYTNPGFLTMMPYTVTWYADYRGPLLFRMASNDFVLTGKLIVNNRSGGSLPASAFSLGGFMVRNPKTLTNGANGWVPGLEDYVFLSIGLATTEHPSCPGCPSPHFEVKSTNNSNSDLNISSVTGTEAEIRMVVLHPYVLVLYRLPNQSWIVHRRYLRADLANTVQVGMVSYTDWDKVSTYSMPFHNSHVLNDDLNPDPSSNPGLPFSPDIVTKYDYLQLLSTTMPAAWIGLDLTNENQVSNAAILAQYGNNITAPVAPNDHIWLGRTSTSWNTTTNWLNGNLPSTTDTVRVNACSCPQANCLEVPLGQSTIGGLNVMENAVITIPAGATLEVGGQFTNNGSLIVFGHLIVHASPNAAANNLGVLDCRTGGTISILD